MKKPTITAGIITKNEEKFLEGCLKSLFWVDDIVIIDSQSEDCTLEIAKKYTKNIVSHEFDNYRDQKNRLLSHIKTDWLITLDADERSTPQFRKSVQNAISSPDEYSAFEVKVGNIFLGRKMNNGGWENQFVVRVFKTSDFKGWDGVVHEAAVVNGKIGRLDAEFYHLSHRNIAENLQKTIGYSRLEAEWRFKANYPKVTTRTFFDVMAREFYRRGLKGRGFLDGVEGWIEIIYQTFSVFITYARLWELQRGESLEESYKNIDRKISKLNEQDKS